MKESSIHLPLQISTVTDAPADPPTSRAIFSLITCNGPSKSEQRPPREVGRANRGFSAAAYSRNCWVASTLRETFGKAIRFCRTVTHRFFRRYPAFPCPTSFTTLPALLMALPAAHIQLHAALSSASQHSLCSGLPAAMAILVLSGSADETSPLSSSPAHPSRFRAFLEMTSTHVFHLWDDKQRLKRGLQKPSVSWEKSIFLALQYAYANKGDRCCSKPRNAPNGVTAVEVFMLTFGFISDNNSKGLQYSSFDT
ncbi:hypothetical protein Tcan_01476 [Toxocara canis]|uniref:Uncharacterized protein n=1 Tax=Toxocara canis TaxID=6265 RepID=A0A0B2UT07_TOXCA|nr:hypothetical protein Tcan_01476 [Toxocara canis]